MDKELLEIQKQIEDKEKQEYKFFEPKQEIVEVKEEDPKDKLIENMFEQAVVAEVTNNADLQNQVLDTAKKYTETKMKVIETNVDTEHKEANFNNKKDACESYGFNEKTTPIWATNVMTWGYNVMLAIWLFLGTFTFMPVIFIAKKISVGLKKTWLAVIFAIILYVCATVLPIAISILSNLR